MPTPYAPAPAGDLHAAWRELWTQANADAPTQPWLLRLLAARGPVLAAHYAGWRRRLARLRPGELRRLQRHLGLSLAGAALLLALLGAPQPAHAATITVNGTTCTLADAITAANTDTAAGGCAAGSGADTLNITANIGLTAPLPAITSAVTIEGNGRTISRASGTFGILQVTSGGDLTLNSATISGGSAGNNGGGIYADSARVMVTNSALSGNTAGAGGGIAAHNNSTVTVTNSILSTNSAGYFGGGIFLISSEMTVQNSILSGNSAGRSGGGISVGAHSRVVVLDSTLSGNSADRHGGGIDANFYASVTVQNSTLSGNSARFFGGGIYASDYATLMMQNSILSDNSTENSAGASGGGIFAGDDVLVTVASSSLSGNSAADGGGIFANSATVMVTNSTLSGNPATNGGGIFADGGATTVTVTGSILSGNTATNGGGIYAYLHAKVTVTNSTLSGNFGALYGGGIYARSATVAVTNSTLSGNSVNPVGLFGSIGGGIFANAARVTVSNSTLSGNSANRGGGIYAHSGATVTVQNSIVAAQLKGGDCVTSGATVTSGGYNIETFANCGFAGPGDQQNTAPRLKALSGGVHVPENDSPAIDGGNPAGCGVTTDQRGQARDDLRCDVGAVEVKLSDTDTVVKNVNATGAFTFGPTLAKIVVTTQGTLSQLAVTHTGSDHPNATRMNGQWWDITPTGSGFTANLDLPHTVNPDAAARVCKHMAGSTWDCERTGSNATRVWRDGISTFSDWAVGDKVSATPVTLQDMRAQAAGGEWAGLGAALLAALAGVVARLRRAEAGGFVPRLSSRGRRSKDGA